MHPLEALPSARQPVIAFGAGIRDCADEAREYAKTLGVPVVVTWGARDLFPEAVGAFGTHGTLAANLAVQNCDWFLSIGTRLDTKATGWPPKLFAPKSSRWMVDIDRAEIEKFQYLGLEIDGVCMEATEFMRDTAASRVYDFALWRWQCEQWKQENPPGPGDPYDIMIELSRHLRPDDTIVSDTGCVVAWAMQALEMPAGCRFIHAWNMTPMGYGLPAAVGAAFATGKRVILLTGDGGLSVNITEMATIAKHRLPVKVLLFDNAGFAMCRQTQRVWLGGRYHGADAVDLATPDYCAVARAYGLEISDDLRQVMETSGPAFVRFAIDQEQGVNPQVKFGEPLA